MTVSLYNCWNCDKPLEGKKLTKRKGSVDLFFYCDSKCKDEHEKTVEKNTQPYHQWSAYMAGERKNPPRKLAHLAEKWGPKDDKVKFVPSVDDEPEEKPKGRKCGKCGKPGHNARTCGKRKKTPRKRRKKKPASPKKVTRKRRKPKRKTRKKSSKKTRGRKQYRCGTCHELGHNARTCKEK